MEGNPVSCVRESWALESGIPKVIETRNPSSTDTESESSSWNPESVTWNPDSKIVLDSLT